MAFDPDDLVDLISGLGGASSAAGALGEVLERLTAATAANAAATQAAAAAQRAAGEEARASAASSKQLDQLAASHQAHDKASIALSGTLESAVGKATGSIGKLGDAGILSGEQVAGLTSKITEGAAALGPYAAAAEIAISVISYLGEKLWALGEAAVRLTQEKDALRTTFDAFTGGAGDELLGNLEDLSAKLPFTADKLNAWAQSLLAAGVQGEALDSSLQAIAASAALLPKNGGVAAEGLIKRFAMMAAAGQQVTLDRRILNQLGEAGVRVEDLAKQLGVPAEKLGGMKIAADKLGDAMKTALISKGGPALERMGNTWASISAKLTEGWEDAFEDLGDIVGPFMAQLRSLASEFFAGSIAGGTFKDVIKAVLTPAFEVATRTVRAMHIAFLYAQIAYLKAAIALKPVTDALKGMGVAGGIVNVAMYLIAGTAVILAVVLGVLALAVFLIVLPFLVLAVAIYGVVRAVQYLIGVFSGAVENFDNLSSAVKSSVGGILDSIVGMVSGAVTSLLMLPVSAFQAGLNFVQGLAQAIVSGQGPIADAVRNLAASAVGAIKGALGIASPSRVARQMGGYFTQGLEGGIDAGTDDVEAAAAGAGDAATGGLGKGLTRKAGRSGGQGKGDRVFAPVFHNCSFGGGLTQETVNDMMATWWEMQAAAGPEPEPA